ncbi:MAG: ABC transporter ATP-binding protein [Burkholderiales bacterium]|nr:ABC transporter ATP-binding protein [Burkholderiales bacterium]
MQEHPPAAAPHPQMAALPGRLHAGENVVATLEVDLDADGRFAQGLIALTNSRLLAFEPGSDAWSEQALSPEQSLKLSDHGGLAFMELFNTHKRLARWRFTLACNPLAVRFVDAFERELQRLAGQAPCAVETEAEEEAFDFGESSKPPSTWVLLRLWRFARPYQGQLLLGFALMLGSIGATLVSPYLTMPLMDRVLIPFQNGQSIDTRLVTMLLSGLLGAALFSWLLGWAKTYLLALVSERIAADLRTATFDHLLGLSLEYFGNKRTGDLMSRIGSETDRISVFLSLHALDFITDVLMLAMISTILFNIHPGLALATLVPLPFIAWMIHLVRDRLRTGFEKIDRVWGEVTNILADTIPGIRVVKAFAQERREAQRFREANAKNLEVNDRLNKTWSLFTPTVALLTEMGLLVVWGVGIWLISHQSITVGTLTAFLAYIGRFYGRLDSMSRIVSVTQKAAAGAKRIFDILDHVSNVPDPVNPLPFENVTGAISMQGLNFRYGSRSVVRNLNLDIRPGEMVGLVGHSGSGKSTLVNLICRFYDVTEGAIKVDGVDLRRIRVSDYRRHIGLVLQEPFLFFGTIAENIAYGKPDASRDEIVAAARAAHAHEFILRLPHGYDSLVGERGQGLSGGERQRISIARALLIDPAILILDEATSAVDTETEKEIQRALDNLVKGRTTIAIAHRLSTLRKADRLVVMDRGEIVELGPHDELIAQQGHYWRLWEAQARRVDAEAAEDAGLMVVAPNPNAHTVNA